MSWAALRNTGARRVVVGLSVVAGLWAPLSEANTYYVASSNGNDAIACDAAQNITTPKRTIPGGISCLNAGDTLYIRGGSYTVTRSNTDRTMPVLNPPSGMPGRVVTVSRYGNEVVSVTYAASATGNGPILGTNGRSYVTWNGIQVIEVAARNQLDTGPTVIWASDHIAFQNMDIVGVPQTATDNHNAIRINDSNHVTISNNRLHGIQGADLNQALIMSYNTDAITVVHNEFYGAYTGIAIKGPTDANTNNLNWVIRFNVFHDVQWSVRTSNARYVEISQNISYDPKSVAAALFECSQVTQDVYVYNNTIYGGFEWGLVGSWVNEGQSNIRMYNNLVVGASHAIYTEAPRAWISLSNYNNFYGYTDFVDNNVRLTLADWQSATGLDLNSIVRDPLFENAVGLDFHLQPGSPARGAGRVGGTSTGASVDMGAYLTGTEIMGPVPLGAAGPSAPTRVIVQ